MTSRRKKIIASVVVVALAGSAAGVFASTGGSQAPPPLPSPQDMYHFGVTVSPAHNSTVPVLPDQAAAAAVAATGGVALNHELAHCQIPSSPPVDTDCYLELMDPTKVVAGEDVTWFVVAVDATTGKAIHWFSYGPGYRPPTATITTPTP